MENRMLLGLLMLFILLFAVGCSVDEGSESKNADACPSGKFPCWDGSCVVDPEECPCSPGDIRCPDGLCVEEKDQCAPM